MKKLQGLALIALLLVFPILNQAWAADLSKLRVPDITMEPTSGPPGTKITITVSNLPDVTNEPYPYPDFFIYLPFSKEFGVTLPSACQGEDCYPIYTFEDSQRKNFADRTITFSLFSVNNPKPVYNNGVQSTVCDVKINDKTVENFLTLCNTKSQQPGVYDIKLAWVPKGNPEQASYVKTLSFTVTEEVPVTEQPVERPSDQAIKMYQQGLISEAEFDKRLRDIGWSDEQIRQAKAVIGKLPHQLGGAAPEQKESIEQGIQKAEQKAQEEKAAQETTTPASTPKSGCLIATAAFGSELAPQVQMLRELRDKTVLETQSGTSFMTAFNAFYYTFSPTVADWERENPVFKEMVKTTITPMITTLSILDLIPIHSEAEMIFYGIGIILLNIGMYFAAPVFAIIKLRQHKKK